MAVLVQPSLEAPLVRMMQEVVKRDPKNFSHKTITSVNMDLPLHLLEVEVVLEGLEESKKALAQIWVWALCWLCNVLQQRGTL